MNGRSSATVLAVVGLLLGGVWVIAQDAPPPQVPAMRFTVE